MKLAIFLGAGASAAENSPIQDELFKEYFKSIKYEDLNSDMNVELHKFFKEMFNIDVIKDDIEKINFPTFEEVLGLLDLAEQRREDFKNFGLEVFCKKCDGIRFIREYLILLMVHSIHKSGENNHRYHTLLLEGLYKAGLLLDTTFISVNYDIHIDNTIASMYNESKHPIMLDYGIEFNNFEEDGKWKRPADPSIKLYKIHGSLNWLYCPICNSLTLTPYEGGVMRLLSDCEDANCLSCGEHTRPIIVPPTYFKNMSNIYLSTVWSEAEKSLREADALLFCGYSFPGADIHIKYMIKRVQTSRKKKPLKIMVFNGYKDKPKATHKKEEARYKRFLGTDITFTNNSFQDFARDPLKFINTLDFN